VDLSEFLQFLMGRIKPLAPDVVNKIKAGEVVHSPQQVVKELLENALDASSSSISIVITDGGLKKIQIQDTGCGIEVIITFFLFLETTTKHTFFSFRKMISNYFVNLTRPPKL